MRSFARTLFFSAGLFAAGAAAALAQTVTVDASQPQGPLLAEQNMDFTGTRGPLDRQLLQNLPMRLVTNYNWPPSSAPGVYDFSNCDPAIQDALSYGAHSVMNCFGGMQYAPSGVAPSNWDTTTVANFQQYLLGAFAHIKSVDPGWQYLEMCIEPDNIGYGESNALALYQAAASAVVQFNATLAPGVPPVLIGGLGALWAQQVWVPDLANMCAANGLPLDFATWHGYISPDTFVAANGGGFWPNGNNFVQMVQLLDSAMSGAGFPGRPQFITECGVHNNDDGNIPPSPEDASNEAAGWAELSAFCVASGHDVRPFWFAWDQSGGGGNIAAANGQDQWGYGTLLADGTMNPLFSTMQAWSLLKGTTLSTSSDSLPNNGGVGSIDSAGVAVLVYNCGASSSVNLQVNNLPSNFQSGSIQYQKYQVDDNTSNYWSNSSNFLLQQVASTTLGGNSSYSETVQFAGSGVALIILTPATAGSIPPPSTPLPSTPPPSTPPPSGTVTLQPGTNYTLTNVNSGLDLDVQHSGTTLGTTVWQYTPNGTAAQIWQFGQFSSGEYYLVNPNSNLFLGVQNDQTAPGSPVVLSTPDGSGACSWTIGQWTSGAGAGTYYLQNVRSRLYLGVQNDSTAVGTLAVISSPDGSGATAWRIADPPGSPTSGGSPGAGSPSPGVSPAGSSVGSSGGKKSCGLTGLETVLVLGLLALRRRRP